MAVNRRHRVNLLLLAAVLMASAAIGAGLHAWSMSRARALPQSARLAVDGVRPGMAYRTARSTIQSRCTSYEECQNYWEPAVGKGTRRVIFYKLCEDPRAMGGEVVLTPQDVVEGVFGYTLEADGVSVLGVGDEEARAIAVLGPAARYVPEGSLTIGGYWKNLPVSVMFESNIFEPDHAPITVKQVQLWKDPL